MATSPVFEGDTIILYCSEAKGFVFSQPPCSSYSHITIFPVPAPQSSAYLKDPAFPNIHFASFQVLPENSNIDLECYSPLGLPVRNQKTFSRSLVYGRKIKLLHVASKKYLSIRPLETGNPIAYLSEKDDDSSLFRILPIRIGKLRGEDVQSEDTVKLECVAEKGHHVLCTPNTLTSRYELKMAVTDSVFVIYSHTSTHTTMSHKALRGGGIVMLFNVKRESYVAGRGSIATECLPDGIRQDIITEVGARRRETVHGIQKAPPNSGDCFWQLEKTDNPLSGDQFQYNDKCRIKHLPTQSYLAVIQKDHKYELSLKKLTPGLQNDPDVTFSLVSVQGHTGGIVKGSYVELRHIGTGQNLTAQSKSFLQRGVSDASTDAPISKWYKLVLLDSERSKQQYFRIEEVKDDLIHEYYHVSGVVSVLREYMEKFTAVDKSFPFPLVLDELIEVLKELAEWISSSSLYQKSRANMLRVAQGVDMLVGFLHEVTDYSDTQLFLLCRNVCLVLKRYLEGSNRKSHLYLAEKRFIDTLFSRIGYGLGVEKVLSSLVKDESGVTESVVERMTNNPEYKAHILKNIDAATLDFLSTLCYSGGRPSKTLQNDIREIVIGSGKDIIFDTTVDNDQVIFKSPNRLIGPVSQICSKWTAKKNQKDFDFFVAQLKLFSRLCQGVNFDSINKICTELEYVTFEEALICINDPKFHPLLRSAYLDFVISAFVDYNVEESGTDIDNIWHSYFWGEIVPNPMQAAGVGDTFEVIPNAEEIRALQASIRIFLAQNKILYAEEELEGQNELLTEMLSVMEPLVSYGFYWNNEDIIEIINLLIDILDGTSDRPKTGGDSKVVVKYQTKGRYKTSHQNRNIFHVKTKAVTVLHLFFKQLAYMALGKFIYDFKSLSVELEVSPDEEFTPANETLALLLNEDYELTTENAHHIEIARDRLRYYFTETAYPFFDSSKGEGQCLVKILLDLLKYDDDQLRLSSILLLFDIYQEENILFKDAQISYIVTPPSVDSYSEMVITGSFSDDPKILLRMIQGTAISGEVNEELVSHLNDVAGACILEDDVTLPHACNQGIAFSTGVFTAIITYVLHFSSTDNEQQDELLRVACHTLQRIIRKNDQGQRRVFASFVDFLEVKIAVSSVAQLLTETLNDNIEICRKLSEADVRLMFQVANNGLEYYEFYVTLEALMKVSKSSPTFLKNFQELVSQIFSEYITEYFGKILTSNNGEHRITTLIEYEDDDSRLVQLLCVCDMLATCAEGQCKFAEDLCQSIFTLEELVSIVGNPSVSIERKKPFARLLNWAYLNTERDSLVSISTVTKNDLIWAHLEQCAILTNVFSAKIQNEEIDPDQLRLLLKILMSQHISIQNWMKRSEDIKIPINIRGSIDPVEDEDEGPAVTGAQTVLLNSLLLYLVDGMIPLVISFCNQLATYNSSGLTSKIYSSLLTPRVVSVLKSVGDSIGELLIKNPEIFATSSPHVQLFNGCLESLVFLLPPEECHMLNQARGSTMQLGDEYFKSPAILEYEAELGEEWKLNEQFKIFARNFKITYEGRVQQSVESGIKEGEHLLPGGTSFIELVKLFADDNLSFAIEMHQSQKLEKAKNLLILLDILFRQLQQPLTGRERTELDFMLLTTLQVLSGVVHTQIESIDHTLQSEDPDKFESEYDKLVRPLQDRLVLMKSHEKVMPHLSHPKDEIAVQVLVFLRVLLYLGNEEAQHKLGHLTRHRDTKFFVRIKKLLENVVTRLGKPVSRTLRQLSLVPPPPSTDNEIVKEDHIHVALEEQLESSQDQEQLLVGSGENSAAARRRLQLVDTSITSAMFKSMSYGSIDDLDQIDDLPEVEETDFGGLVKRTVRAYSISGAGQLEITTDDAIKTAGVVLDVVSWLCDGQNREMQEILRKQEFDFSNVNIVAEIAVLLQTLSEHLNSKNMGITQKAIQALIEMCAGNYTNQEMAFKGQIVDSINIILRHLFFDAESELVELLEVRASAIELLEVMLEETHEKSRDLAQGISDDLNVNALLIAMLELEDLSQSSSYEHLKVKTSRGVFRAYHVLKRIADYLDITVDEYVKPKEKFEGYEKGLDMWTHVTNWSRSIEVNYFTKEGKEILTRVYFPYDPARELTEDEKDVVKNNIVRESPEDKVKDLLEWMDSIKKNIRRKFYIRSKPWLIWSVFLSGPRHLTLLFLTLLLNLFVIILFEVPDDQKVRENDTNLSNAEVTVILNPMIPTWYANYFLYILGSVHLILGLWMLIEYFVREYPNILVSFPTFENILWDLKKWVYRHEHLKNLSVKASETFGGVTINPPGTNKCFELYLLSFAPLYRILFVICSILALGTHGYFYCGCILYVFLKSEVLHQVLTAVRRSALQLIVVGLLGLAVLLIYAVLSFAFLHNFYDPAENLFCNTMYQCFISVIREGLLDNLGSTLPLRFVGQEAASFTIYWTRTIFDITFFIIITTLGLNIVVAILVDRFSELRSERDEIKKDKLNYCFICGIDNDTFERKAKGFRHHVQNDHSKWNYIYFVLHLDSLYTNDHNALEKYVFDNIQERTIGFFPLRKAKVLNGTS